MCVHKIYSASSICLLAFLLLIACHNPEKKTAPPSGADTTNSIVNPSIGNTLPQNDHTHTVEIKGMKFNPQELTIHRGDTVVWINNDITNHCVTEINKAWTSSALKPGQSFKKTITGNIDYYCAIHMVMKGKILVE